jgi:hypothetical protein
MKVIFVILSLATTLNASAVLIETDHFSVKTSKQYARQNNPEYCRYKTRVNQETNQLEIRVGVVGSPVDFFGWNMPIDLQELPLTDGFRKEYKSPGVTVMVMTYANNILTFKRMKNENVWNRLYPFKLKIDPSLSKPTFFQGDMMGYERTVFGGLKKHVSAKCNFK